MADFRIDDSQMVDNLNAAFMSAVLHAQAAADTSSRAVFASYGAHFFGRAADGNLRADRQQFNDVVRTNAGAFTAAGAQLFINLRKTVFAHGHSAEGAGFYAVAETETAVFTEFRTLLYDFSGSAVMNAFVFIGQFLRCRCRRGSGCERISVP